VSVGVIVGVVIGVIVIVGIIIFIIIYFIILRPNNKNKNDDDVSKNVESIEMNGLEIFDEIGHGATSTVYKGRYNGKDVAVKVMKQEGSFEKELELMMKLKNPYIIEVYDKCVVSGHDGYVMEYVGLGSLDVVMSQQVFSDSLKMRYGREICLGMRYLHSMNIIHRDLKLENILIMSTSESSPDAICKISDFGTARETDISNTITMTQSMTMTSNIGTPLYMAPEILSGQSHYSMKADIYSYGIVLCGLWNQQIPYSDESFSNVTEFLTRITNQEHRPSLKQDCPRPYIQLVTACLQSNPHSRPSFDEIASTVFGVN
jgi:serine/threonine protein kinase